MATVQEQKQFQGLTYIEDKPIWIKHTTARLAHDIIEHNSATKFTTVLGIGVPGSGKSTGLTGLIHSIHNKDDNYAIYHKSKEDFIDMAETLDSLPKYQDCIVVFDDISYVLSEIPEKAMSEILYKLSVVREILDPKRKQTRCIIVLIFHYSFAVPKGLRSQANFRIQFSITDEERENYNKTMGYYNRKNIYKFMRKYIGMMRYRSFSVAAPRGFKDKDGKPVRALKYARDNPFRLALVSNLGELHYMLYHRASCGKCQPKKGQSGKIDTMLVADLVAKEGLSRVYKNCRFLSYFNGNKFALTGPDRRILKHLDDLFKGKGIDPSEIFELLKGVKGQRRGDRAAYFGQKLKELEQLSTEDQQKVAELASKIEPLEGDEKDIDIGEEEGDEEEDTGFDDPASIFKGDWWRK